jgi:hypothetical protein
MADRFSKASFLEWSSHPLTKTYRRLLKDSRDRLADQWARCIQMSPEQQFQALFLQEHSTLNWSDVEDMYKANDEQAASAEEADREDEEDQPAPGR